MLLSVVAFAVYVGLTMFVCVYLCFVLILFGVYTRFICCVFDYGLVWLVLVYLLFCCGCYLLLDGACLGLLFVVGVGVRCFGVVDCLGFELVVGTWICLLSTACFVFLCICVDCAVLIVFDCCLFDCLFGLLLFVVVGCFGCLI